jgi:hypothetical protein
LLARKHSFGGAFLLTKAIFIDILSWEKSVSEEKKPLRKDRARAKKKNHKLTKRHVDLIRSQKGKMSVREISKWFAQKTHYIYKVSPTMVHYILTERYHKSKENKVSIYDLIENDEFDEEELNELDPRDVNYE